MCTGLQEMDVGKCGSFCRKVLMLEEKRYNLCSQIHRDAIASSANHYLLIRHVPVCSQLAFQFHHLQRGDNYSYCVAFLERLNFIYVQNSQHIILMVHHCLFINFRVIHFFSSYSFKLNSAVIYSAHCTTQQAVRYSAFRYLRT